MQIDLFNQELVQELNGELLVSSLVISENINYDHRNILQLVRQNISDFEQFGRVTFEMQSFVTNGGIQTGRDFILKLFESEVQNG